jgi:hypothetical protein
VAVVEDISPDASLVCVFCCCCCVTNAHLYWNGELTPTSVVAAKRNCFQRVL